MAYSDDIKNGNWQQKRLEIMQRDNFQCLCCHEPFQLNVHHLYYEPNKKIWEYDNEALVTLCDRCHNILHKDLMKLGGIIAFQVLVGNIDITALDYGRLDKTT